MNENLNKKAEIVSETLETVSEAIDKVQRVILQAEDMQFLLGIVKIIITKKFCQ